MSQKATVRLPYVEPDVVSNDNIGLVKELPEFSDELSVVLSVGVVEGKVSEAVAVDVLFSEPLGCEGEHEPVFLYLDNVPFLPHVKKITDV